MPRRKEVGHLLCVFALLAQEPNPPLRAKAILPLVAFEQTDVREAFRWLFREGRFGGIVAPDVQGVITIRLADVPWEVALQQISRQVDATYRFEHGFVEVVRRDASEPAIKPPPAWPTFAVRQEIEAGYRWLRYKIAFGKGDEIASWVIAGTHREKDTEEVVTARSLIDTERSSPNFSILAFDRRAPKWERDESANWLSVDVAYSSPKGEKTLFTDFWRQEGSGPWRLARRRKAGLNFVEADVRKVLSEIFRRVGASYSVDPSIQGKVTLDLTGQPFEAALSKLLQAFDATYFIEAGVYHVVPRS